MNRFLAAVRFLTVVPVPGRCGTREQDLAGSVPCFPLVGLLLGAIAAAMAWVASLYAPPLLAALAIIVTLMALSGCLHLDGLSDTADGLLSSRSPPRMLEIMKDSHIGAMGVIAVVCLVLAKFAALASVAPGQLWRTALLMPLAGRCAIVVHMALLPYVRPEGLGAVFCRRRARWSAIWAATVLLAVAWGILGRRGIAVAVASLAVAAVFAVYLWRKIGGTTGDTFGAVCELAEAVPAIVMALGTVTAGGEP
jgi:adenosylcobinamide-GDP ribazoletransferase